MELEKMPSLLKVSEVAKLFRVSERTIYTWIEMGYLRAFNKPGCIRIPKEAIIEFIDENQTIDKPYKMKR
jgi:excisionase family DNA binding protein